MIRSRIEPFIPGQAPAAEGGVAVKAPQTPSIKTVFTLKSEDVHTQSNGTQVQCFWWTCVQKGCELELEPQVVVTALPTTEEL